MFEKYLKFILMGKKTNELKVKIKKNDDEISFKKRLLLLFFQIVEKMRIYLGDSFFNLISNLKILFSNSQTIFGIDEIYRHSLLDYGSG